MVTLLLDSSRLEVALSATERVLAFRKDAVRVERAHIAKVQLVDDPWSWLRGVPNPGTVVPRTVAMGVWRSAGGDDFVLVRRRRPSVVIDLEGDPEFQRLVLTTRADHTPRAGARPGTAARGRGRARRRRPARDDRDPGAERGCRGEPVGSCTPSTRAATGPGLTGPALGRSWSRPVLASRPVTLAG